MKQYIVYTLKNVYLILLIQCENSIIRVCVLVTLGDTAIVVFGWICLCVLVGRAKSRRGDADAPRCQLVVPHCKVRLE